MFRLVSLGKGILFLMDIYSACFKVLDNQGIILDYAYTPSVNPCMTEGESMESLNIHFEIRGLKKI